MYRDDESGLSYSLFRYYNPETGRFVTEDPLGRWFDLQNLGNGYSWVANQYRNGWDPLGLHAENKKVRRLYAGIKSAIEKLPEAERHDKGDLALIYESMYTGAIALLAVSDKAMAEWDLPGQRPIAYTFDRGHGKFRILFRNHNVRVQANWRVLFNLMHELRHVALYRRGLCTKKHHGKRDSKSWREFNTDVWILIHRLVRAGALKVTNSELKSMKSYGVIEKKVKHLK